MDKTACHGGEIACHGGETAYLGKETACHGGETTMEDRLSAMEERLPLMEERLPLLEERQLAMEDTLPAMEVRLPTMEEKLSAVEERLPAWMYQLQEEVCLLAEIRILKPFFSPWSVLMVPVWKPDGSMRLSLNFRRINAVTTPDPYLIPRVDDMLTQIGNTKFLMKLDLNKEFHQIQLLEEDKCKADLGLRMEDHCILWGGGDVRTSLQLERQKYADSLLDNQNMITSPYIS